jgi:hypothetical protein
MAGNIWRVLQALKLDTTDQRGGSGPKLASPFHFQWLLLRGFRRNEGWRGPVAQGIERPPPKRQVDGSNPSGVTTSLSWRFPL